MEEETKTKDKGAPKGKRKVEKGAETTVAQKEEASHRHANFAVEAVRQ